MTDQLNLGQLLHRIFEHGQVFYQQLFRFFNANNLPRKNTTRALRQTRMPPVDSPDTDAILVGFQFQ